LLSDNKKANPGESDCILNDLGNTIIHVSISNQQQQIDSMNISFAIFLCREKIIVALLNPIDLLASYGKKRDGKSFAVYYLCALTLKRQFTIQY
jgi:hypothetical protein